MLIKIDQDFHEHLTTTEKHVINFINANPDKVAAMSILEVAEQTFSSPATVSRTIKKCGISGFAELRYLLAQQAETTRKDSIEVNDIFNKSLLEVTNTIDHLSTDTILRAVKEIKEAKRIYLLSRGLTELVAREFERVTLIWKHGNQLFKRFALNNALRRFSIDRRNVQQREETLSFF